MTGITTGRYVLTSQNVHRGLLKWPTWLPKEVDSLTVNEKGCLQVLFKPQAKRMQVEIPLNQGLAEYNTDADSSVRLGSIKLDSTLVDMRTTHAVLTIR